MSPLFGAGLTSPAGAPKATVTATTGSPTVDTSSRAGKTIYKFTGSGSITIGTAGLCEVLAVGGGGAGSSAGGSRGGGGGGGTVITDTAYYVAAGTHTVTIGAGGSAYAMGPATSNKMGNCGIPTTLGTNLVALGGGSGSAGDSLVGLSGGNGGGESDNGGKASALLTTGFAGGNAFGLGRNASAGGGGAGAVGGDAIAGSNGGPGGAGVASSITGSSVTYGGGGGGCGNVSAGAGGAGGGGAGCKGDNPKSNGVAGTANTGGGGGGGLNATDQLSRAGGSGYFVLVVG
jgi:hypothetical protein